MRITGSAATAVTKCAQLSASYSKTKIQHEAQANSRVILMHTVAFLLTGTFPFHICRKLQAGMAQGRPWGYLWAYRSPNFWPSGGLHLLPWVGQCTFPPRRARGALVENAAALIWALHPGA